YVAGRHESGSFWRMPMNDSSSATQAPALPPAASSREPSRTPPSVLGDAVSAPPVSAPPVNADEKTVISNRSQPLQPLPPAVSGSQQLGQSLVGKRLEHYDLDEFVGGGGMGAVFRATDTRLGRTVAVKILSRDHTDEETIRRFRNE